MTDYDALEKRLPELDRLYRAHLVAATIENWQQHCELWRLEAHNALTAIRDLRAERDALRSQVVALLAPEWRQAICEIHAALAAQERKP